MNFWTTLERPFTILAPMEDVTDHVFRRLVCDHGEPDVLVTEFTSAAMLCSDHPERALQRLEVYEGEFARRPLVAQIWGSDPTALNKAAALVARLGFAGVDINMGCPVKKISKKGACSALIRFPQLAAELIQAVREGAGELPVSVKTRIGWSRPETETWCGHLLDQDLAALTIHGRTVKQKSEGWADWNEIAKVVRLRDEKKLTTRIIGNGDVSKSTFEEKLQSGVDGLMIGRGVFSDLGLFRKGGYRPYETWSREEKLALMERQIRDHQITWGRSKDYEKLKKFFKVYTVGFDGALELRELLMQTHDHEASLALIEEWKALRRESSGSIVTDRYVQ